MKQILVSACALLGLGVAQAQAQSPGAGLSVSAGLKAWNTQWTTFGYYPESGAQVLKQVAARDKAVLLPSLTVRYDDFVATLSGYTSTRHDLGDQVFNTRKEYDLGAGYYVLPGLALTLGYKKTSQLEVVGTNRFELAGPVVGLNAVAPLNGWFSVYGALGLGKLRPVGNVDLNADYRLTEVGLAYSFGTERFLRSVSLTAGYRTQALTSKRALDVNGQDGRDLTQGLTLGLFGTY